MFQKSKLVLRKADSHDMDILYKWINDKTVRKVSFNKDAISYETHKKWFRKTINDKNVLIYILDYKSFPVGMIRFENKKNIGMLSYLISKESRGMKLGKQILLMGVNQINNLWDLNDIYAETVPLNISSIKSLESAGFSLNKTFDNKLLYVFSKDKQ